MGLAGLILVFAAEPVDAGLTTSSPEVQQRSTGA